jgi:hypothetical protein
MCIDESDVYTYVCDVECLFCDDQNPCAGFCVLII